MRSGPRFIIFGIVIVVLIGLKVYNRTPRWREGIEGNREIPLGKAFFQSFTLKKSGTLRLTVTEKDKRPLLVYWLTKKDADAMAGGDVDPERLTQRMSRQILCQCANLPTPKEFELPSGEFCIYFEAIPEEGDERSDPYRIAYRIEEHR